MIRESGQTDELLLKFPLEFSYSSRPVSELAPLLLLDPELDRVRAASLDWSRANAELGDEQTELFIGTTKSWKRRKELRETDPPRGRIPKSYGPKERMERKLRTKRGRRIYAKRGSTVEPVFGRHVNRCCDRFVSRGKTGAQAEWSLFSLTHNVMKL